MSAVIFDTNVCIVANRAHSAASPTCVRASTEALRKGRTQLVLLDNGQRILREYRKHLSAKGQPGVGDAFFKWLWENQANPERCGRIVITECAEGDREYEEFPDDASLRGFDRSDQKFVAVAIASQLKPTIVNATDSDWHHYKVALEPYPLELEFLCPELMTKGTQ